MNYFTGSSATASAPPASEMPTVPFISDSDLPPLIEPGRTLNQFQLGLFRQAEQFLAVNKERLGRNRNIRLGAATPTEEGVLCKVFKVHGMDNVLMNFFKNFHDRSDLQSDWDDEKRQNVYFLSLPYTSEVLAAMEAQRQGKIVYVNATGVHSSGVAGFVSHLFWDQFAESPRAIITVLGLALTQAYWTTRADQWLSLMRLAGVNV